MAGSRPGPRGKRPSPLETKLGRVAELRKAPSGAGGAELLAFLGEAEPYLVARTAELIAEQGLVDLVPGLAAAFRRLVEGSQPDPGCTALAKVAQSLSQLVAYEPELYLLGLGLVRRERSGTVFVDAAVPVRAECAMALVRIAYRDALLDLAPLLADDEAPVRAAVARAIGDLGSDGAAAVLPLKLRVGDADPDVLGACMAGLLVAAPARFLPTVAGYLDDGELGELAAIALGESRKPEAFPLLRDALGSRRTAHSSAILVALALLRTDQATDHLLDVLAKAPESLAEQALGALAVQRHLPILSGRVRTIVEGRGEPGLRRALVQKFGDVLGLPAGERASPTHEVRGIPDQDTVDDPAAVEAAWAAERPRGRRR